MGRQSSGQFPQLNVREMPPRARSAARPASLGRRAGRPGFSGPRGGASPLAKPRRPPSWAAPAGRPVHGAFDGPVGSPGEARSRVTPARLLDAMRPPPMVRRAWALSHRIFTRAKGAPLFVRRVGGRVAVERDRANCAARGRRAVRFSDGCGKRTTAAGSREREPSAIHLRGRSALVRREHGRRGLLLGVYH